HTHHAEVWPDGDSDVLEDAPMLLHLAVVHRDTRIVDHRMHYTKRVRLWHPAKIIERPGPVALASGIHFIDGDDLTQLGLLEQVVVMKAPPGSRIAPEALALVGWVGTRSQLHVQDMHGKNVTRFGILYGDRSRTDVHP